MALPSALRKIGIDAYLLTLLGVVALSFFLPARDGFAVFVGQAAYYAVALLFFVHGAKLKTEAVIAGLANWRLQAAILGVTYIGFPLLAFGMVNVLRPVLTDDLALGLLYIGILPSTVQSSIAFTALAKGNVAASVCAASVSNLVGVVLTPLLAMLVLQAGNGGFQGSAMLNIFVQIFLPFTLGQFCRPLIGAWLNRHRLVSLTVDRGSILLIVYSAFSAGMVAGVWTRIDPLTLVLVGAAVCVLLALAIILCLALARLLGLAPEDYRSMLFCGATKSLASGLPIANILFAGGPVSLIILPLMLYHQVQLIVCAIIAQRIRSRDEIDVAKAIQAGG